MANPKIMYTDSNDEAQALLFRYPPVKKPGSWLGAVRTDTIATAGDKQSWHFRTDEFLDLNMAYVEIGEDFDAWDQFLRFALTGDEFEYYPDADVDVHFTCTLEDTDFKPDFVAYGLRQFQLKLRKAV